MQLIIKKLFNDIFYICLITFIVFFMLELIKQGLISNYFDLNLLLILAISLGVLSIIFNKKYDKGS